MTNEQLAAMLHNYRERLAIEHDKIRASLPPDQFEPSKPMFGFPVPGKCPLLAGLADTIDDMEKHIDMLMNHDDSD